MHRPFRSTWSRIVVLAVVVLVPLAVLELQSALDERDEAVRNAGTRATNLATTGARWVDDLFAQTELLLTTVAALASPEELEGPGCRQVLAAGINTGSPYANLYAVAPDGRVQCLATGSSRLDDVGDEGWFTATVQRGAFTVTTPATALTAERPVIIAALPRYAPDGTFAGVVGASVELAALTEFTEDLALPADTAVAVLDDEGRIVERVPDGDRFRGQPGGLADELREAGTSTTVDGTGVDGVRRLYGADPVEVGGTTLLVGAGLSPDVAFAPADDRLRTGVVVLVLTGVAAVALGLVVARSAIVAPLGRLRRAMQAFSAGDAAARAGAVGGPTEVQDLATSFDAMADELGERLERLRDLVVEIEETAERERGRIAAGIHDESLQTLAALSIQLQLLRRRTPDPDAAEALGRVLDQVDATASELRNLLFDLKPPALAQLGLGPALREVLEVKLGTDGPHATVVDDTDGQLPEWVEVLLYRIAQEAVANVAAHARATTVTATIGAEDHRATLELHDDGRGFDVAATERAPEAGHIGLRVMRDRARAAGGDVTVTSAAGVGTTVVAWLPTGDRAPRDAG